MEIQSLRIIRAHLKDGRYEYQVSDGDVGKRTYSIDFNTLHEAEEYLKDDSCD